ncbi:helix-turn-helix domain-containing protein [Sphingobacterium multivorum]|uniref:helix-turn-helix domain-containing protein n=1 Tax=Sphingobacterium multivorum TaxID=28454 RepID=UPI0028A797EE|nr:helix-turn-helix domain-containing protein [Sphingobacterium multivorum]
MKDIVSNPFQTLYDAILELKQEITDLKQLNSAIDDRLMSRQEAAAYLKVHVDTVTRLTSSGQLKKSNIGRNLKFRKSDLDQYLDENA